MSSDPMAPRSIVGLEHELAATRNALVLVDGRNRRLRRGVDYGMQMLVLVAVLALFYVFLLHHYYGR